MKTKIIQLAVVVAALFVTVLVQPAWGQGDTQFDIYIYDILVDRYAPAATVKDNIIAALRTGNLQNGNFSYFPSGSTLPLVSIFNNGTSGNTLRGALVITNSTPFTLAQIQRIHEDPVFGSSTSYFSSYSNLGIGINNGEDGLLGTDDDIIYAQNNVNTPVHAVYMIGVGTTISIGDASLEHALDSWGDYTYRRLTYDINGDRRSSQIYFAVPEPSVAGLLTISLIGLHLKKKRK